MSFCGNVVELVEKYKVFNDDDFMGWNNININEKLENGIKIEVYNGKKSNLRIRRKAFNNYRCYYWRKRRKYSS